VPDMKWTRGHRSDDVEVRRGGGGGGGGLPVGILSLIVSRFGIGGGLLALLAFGAFQLFSGGGEQSEPGVAESQPGAPSSDERVQFASFVLDDVQTAWTQKLPGYKRSKLIIFQGSTSTGCGYGDRAIGPFYCPRDGNVYLDLEFFQTLERKLGAGGDFAQAYVIAHEIGHHVQNLTGISDKVGNASPGARAGAGGLSVKLELQADCFAGVWAHSTEQRNLLETGDVEEALNAAASIGDDKLQKMGKGTVQPETWTHGSSAQRVEWFRRGLKSGDPADCDTFETAAR
jgi:predicted metalloprotease